MTVLVTGGAGFIGSHAVQRLLAEGHKVVAIDNLFRGHRKPMELLAERHPDRLLFEQCDIADAGRVAELLTEHAVDTVMHFAAKAYVGESVDDPIDYYENNTAGSIAMLKACDASGVERFVFSSTAATYGEPPDHMVPIPEDCPKEPINPYGYSKLVFERVLEDWAHARQKAGCPVAFAALRYFNVAGSDRTGLLGEDHTPETHLIPVILQAAMGTRSHIAMFGTDYPTPDGTCQRDYVHVEDLIDAHVRVMEALKPGDDRRYNIGIGRPYSVREVVDAAKRVTGVDFEVREADRRPGDPARLYADPSRIRSELGWEAQVTDLDEIIASAWNWMRKHPKGYSS